MPAPRPLGIVVGVVAALAAAVALTAFVLTTGTASADVSAADDGERGIGVTGVGTVRGTPDVLRFTVGVETAAGTVDAALASANATATRMVDVLRSRGIAEEDLQTANVQVHPRYGDKGDQITGYVARNDLVVRVTDLDGAGALIGAAVDAGGDAARLSGVSFDLEDNEDLLAAARDAAYSQARNKAEQYARLAGKELGAVVSIREDVQPRGPWPADRASADLAAQSVPISPGSTEVAVTVDVRWSMR